MSSPPVSASNLALRRVAIDTYRENVAYLHRECAVYRAEGFQALSKVEVRANGRRILATLNVVDDPRIVGCGELGVSEDAFLQLGVQDGHSASVSPAEPPESIGALHRKIAGERLCFEAGLGQVLGDHLGLGAGVAEHDSARRPFHLQHVQERPRFGRV